ncbi:glutaredoxin 3 [Moraxella sp. VT-16-12]|uniref:glutaredoxin 3 n=1 Tax=Moraxella sp. VT-16-12 TaxID=2014877 RepID=UPI000B7F92E4|nr:glutaredoxin 3 [Moraxella sp. VT-16-12]TWV84833.1 glutaredoxin 3 [Moraxella sp. VT-16-12]
MKPVTIYSKATCPYCISAKRLLDQKGVAYTEIDVFGMSQAETDEVAVKTNHYRTVPKIFIGDTFIGGFSDLDALNRQGKLDELLAN